MIGAATVTLVVAVNPRDHDRGSDERKGYSGQLWRLPVSGLSKKHISRMRRWFANY
jgi:hypothetical protein